MDKQITIQAQFLFQFESFSDWVNNATYLYSTCGYRAKNTIAVDTAGNTCTCGKDMMHARDHRLFPIKVYKI